MEGRALKRVAAREQRVQLGLRNLLRREGDAAGVAKLPGAATHEAQRGAEARACGARWTPVDSLTAQKRLIEVDFGLALLPERAQGGLPQPLPTCRAPRW